ncbi:glycosyltransferase [Clostridium butyricum]|uniref:glycosyltransferase n=1 Tax=Clostridium butyricum TaxID=1492 RepID=UPI000AF380B5|nr:glycosyltransferase [Clostridium butyricum]
MHAHYATSYGLLGALANYHTYIISVWGNEIYDIPIKSPTHKMMVKYNLKKAEYIYSTSNVMKDETKKYTDKDIEVTPCGVEISRFVPGRIEKDEGIKGISIKTLEEK